jgi:putative membrane protein
MMMPGDMFGSGFGMLFMLLFWGLIIVALVAGIRWLVHQSRPANRDARRDSALETLRERYANGEINEEEFDAKKRDLS